MADYNVHTTGYFESPGSKMVDYSTSHIIKEEKPFCGAKMDASKEVVYTSMGVNLDYVKCAKCKRQWKKHIEKGGEL